MEFTQINHSTKIFDELHARFDFFVDKLNLIPQDEFFIVAKLLVHSSIEKDQKIQKKTHLTTRKRRKRGKNAEKRPRMNSSVWRRKASKRVRCVQKSV
jgi:hypothetical protein